MGDIWLGVQASCMVNNMGCARDNFQFNLVPLSAYLYLPINFQTSCVGTKNVTESNVPLVAGDFIMPSLQG